MQPSRSPAASRIVAAAIKHFADRSYDSASLTDIAQAVGIRKASLYAHFSGKDALFLQALEDAQARERAYARLCFAQEDRTALPGSRYCEALIDRYGASDDLRFFLRTSYMPPRALVDAVDQGHEAYLAQLCDDFIANLKAGIWTDDKMTPERIAQLGHAYLGIVDSLQVKLVYTDASHAAVRLAAMQRMLADTLDAART